MIKQDRIFFFLVAMAVVQLIYIGIWGERINSASLAELVALFLIFLSPLVLFFWMAGHCIFNDNLKNKWIWILAFFFTLHIASIFYYFFVYRGKMREQ